MSLYAFYPDGHGLRSFFVCAESEKVARLAIDEYSRGCEDHIPSEELPNDYTMMVFAPGSVTENAND